MNRAEINRSLVFDYPNISLNTPEEGESSRERRCPVRTAVAKGRGSPPGPFQGAPTQDSC